MTSGEFVYESAELLSKTLRVIAPNNYSMGNGLSSVYGYDSLGRLNGGWVCSGSTSASCSGGTQVYGFTNALSGIQLTSSTDSVLGQSSTYGYDEFNRLASRTVTSGSPVNNFSYTYDRYGNRWNQTVTAGSGPQPSLSFTAATNQIGAGGYSYDAAGNMINDGSHGYTYDAEGSITAVDSGSTASYVYNALNQRVQTTVGSTTVNFVFNAAGQRVSEWSGAAGAEIQGKYYWGANPLAYYTTGTGGATHFEHQDWLGTERIRTAYNGGVEGTYTSLPFGDAQATASGTDGDAYHFAMLDSDAESGTDHAQLRQYSSTQGRWLSPDPYSGSYDASNPQSFNRYAYVLNSPTANADPSGLTTWVRPGRLTDGGPGLTYFGGWNPLNTFGSNWDEFGGPTITIAIPTWVDPKGSYNEPNYQPGYWEYTTFTLPAYLANYVTDTPQVGPVQVAQNNAPNNPKDNQTQENKCDAQASQAANSEISAKPGAINLLTSMVSGLVAASSGGSTTVGKFLLTFTKGFATSFSTQQVVRTTMWGSFYTTAYQVCMGEPSTYVPGVTY